jgi:hypothetical protein
MPAGLLRGQQGVLLLLLLLALVDRCRQHSPGVLDRFGYKHAQQLLSCYVQERLQAAGSDAKTPCWQRSAVA